MKNSFFTNYIYKLIEPTGSLKTISRLHLTKALKNLFETLKIDNKIVNNQIIAIILKLSFSDGSTKSISTMRKGSLKTFSKFSIVFKHMLNLRSEDYGSDEIKVKAIVFSYHIYTLDYDFKLIDTDLDFNYSSELSSDKINVISKEEANIKYMNPISLFKLPLKYSGSIGFLQQFKLLNKTTSEMKTDSYPIKYLITIREISNVTTEVIISLQEDSSIVIFKMRDSMITLRDPDINKEILIERTIMSKSDAVYMIDLLTNEILLIKKFN